MLRKSIICLAFASAIFIAATPAGTAVSVFDDIATFVPPAGFTLQSEDLVRKKFPNATTPAVVYANKRATTSIAVTYHPAQALAPEQLPEFRTFMAGFLEKQQPSLEWVKNELIEINGTRWVHLEFVTQAMDAKIHNDMYFTSADQRMLLFNFNSTKSEYEDYREALEQSKSSIRVKAKKK